MNTTASIHWICTHCRQTVWGGAQHFCQQLQAAPGNGAYELRQLTEDDVRRIVREELARDLEERRAKLRAFVAEVHGAGEDTTPPL